MAMKIDGTKVVSVAVSLCFLCAFVNVIHRPFS